MTTRTVPCARRPTVGAGEPAPAVLDPKFYARAGIGADAILGLKEDAATLVALVRLHYRIEPSLHVGGVEQLRVAAAGRDRGEILDAQHVEDVRAPDQRVARDVPMVERFTDRGENVAGVEIAGDILAGRHAARLGGRDDRVARSRILRTVAAHGRLSGKRCSPQVATADGRFAARTIRIL